MYLMRECSGQCLVKIGETFGGRDHTTARHGILKIERDMRGREHHLPPGAGPLADHPRTGRGAHERPWTGLWDNAGEPREAARVASPATSHRFPQPVHMSDGPATLGERGGYPVFHSPYYY